MTFIFRNRTIFWDISKWNRGQKKMGRREYKLRIIVAEVLDLLLILESFPILVIYFLRYYLFIVSFSLLAGCLTYILFQFRVHPQSFEHTDLKKVSLSISHSPLQIVSLFLSLSQSVF